MRSGAVQIGALSLLSMTLVACSSHSTTAYCADRQAPRSGSYRVVPDYYCDGNGSYGRYYWYYGGRYRGGYISHGSSIRPRSGKITSKGGRTIQRGGFGHSSGHSRSG